MKIECETRKNRTWQEKKEGKKINWGLHFHTFIQMNFIPGSTPSNITTSGNEIGKKKKARRGSMAKSKEEPFLEWKTGSGIAVSIWIVRNPCTNVWFCRDETAAAGCVFQWVLTVMEGRGRRGRGEGWLHVCWFVRKGEAAAAASWMPEWAKCLLQRQTAAVQVLESDWHDVRGTSWLF